jgi:hypothetical protein
VRRGHGSDPAGARFPRDDGCVSSA